jgi:hypothetical protein
MLTITPDGWLWTHDGEAWLFASKSELEEWLDWLDN